MPAKRQTSAARPLSAPSRRERAKTGLALRLAPAEDAWFAAAVDPALLARAGIKREGGGPHQSKTMMLPEVTRLLSTVAARRLVEAVLEDNVLGKPSVRARRASLLRLRQLYGLDDDRFVPSIMRALWERDPAGRPLLALLCALARDPTLRDGASAVLDAKPGEPVRWPSIAAAFESTHPARLGEKMAKSLAQNTAASWTQAGFLQGVTRKQRIRANPTPAVAAYAAVIASYGGFSGMRLLTSRWLDVLDHPFENRLALLRKAEGLGLARVRIVGDVVEIDAKTPLERILGM